jgi:hypothetical protein
MLQAVPDPQVTVPAGADTTIPPTTGAVTRSCTRNAADAAADADNTDESHHGSRRGGRDREREPFKGNILKMNGHVFQLHEESRKVNQYTLTVEALSSYAIVEFPSFGEDLAPLFATPIAEPTITELPDLPPLDPTDATKHVPKESRLHYSWAASCEVYDQRIQALATNKTKLCTIILAQCSDSVKPKLEAIPGYEAAKRTYDCKWFLTNLKSICHRFEQSEYRYIALYNAKLNVMQCRQHPRGR